MAGVPRQYETETTRGTMKEQCCQLVELRVGKAKDKQQKRKTDVRDFKRGLKHKALQSIIIIIALQQFLNVLLLSGPLSDENCCFVASTAIESRDLETQMVPVPVLNFELAQLDCYLA